MKNPQLSKFTLKTLASTLNVDESLLATSEFTHIGAVSIFNKLALKIKQGEENLSQKCEIIENLQKQLQDYAKQISELHYKLEQQADEDKPKTETKKPIQNPLDVLLNAIESEQNIDEEDTKFSDDEINEVENKIEELLSDIFGEPKNEPKEEFVSGLDFLDDNFPMVRQIHKNRYQPLIFKKYDKLMNCLSDNKNSLTVHDKEFQQYLENGDGVFGYNVAYNYLKNFNVLKINDYNSILFHIALEIVFGDS